MRIKMVTKKNGCISGVLLLLTIIGCIVLKSKDTTDKYQVYEMTSQEVITEEPNEISVWEKGYDLPVDQTEAKEAETECLEVAASVKKVLKENEISLEKKNVTSEVEKIIMDIIEKKGYPVRGTGIYPQLRNYEEMESFLEHAAAPEEGEIIIYELHSEAGFSRIKFYFDGKEMYYLCTNLEWSDDGEACITSTSYCRIKEWSYTEKGWFCYELCVPEPPEVSEVVYGDMMIRVLPLDEKYIEISEKYLLPIGYQGNNLFCSEWDVNHMEDVDYNGLFEYFYIMRYDKRFDQKQYSQGISEDEFGEMTQKYLPITMEQLKQYAVYDDEQKVFAWERLGCMNYAPTAFGTSIPEVVDMTTNEDGTVSIRIDAICEMIGSDKVFSHELTVKFLDDGGIKYLGNHILEPGLDDIPEYQYRLKKEQ